MANQEIVILGGLGKSGRRVAERLRARGHTPRSASRSSSPRFDWNEPEGWRVALHGARAAYVAYAPDLAAPGAESAIEALIRVARTCGVERLVLLSGRGEPAAQRCERLVQRSGLDFTVLRCAWFAQNFSEGHLAPAVTGGTLRFPAADVREPFLDLDDVAEIAAAALLGAHGGKSYELTGPRLLGFGEALSEIGVASGRELAYQAISHEEYVDDLANVLPRGEAEFYGAFFRELLDGHNASLSDGVERALGRPARDFRDYARDAARAGAFLAP